MDECDDGLPLIAVAAMRPAQVATNAHRGRYPQLLVKPIITVSIGGIAACTAMSAVVVKHAAGPPGSVPVTTWAFRQVEPRDLRFLRMLIEAESRDYNGGNVPEFSSHTAPSWAANQAAVEGILGSGEWSLASDAYGRSWTYSVPASAVGKNYDNLPDSTVVVQVTGSTDNEAVPYAGIKKDGGLVSVPTNPTP